MGEQGDTELFVNTLALCAHLGPGAGTTLLCSEADSEVRCSFRNAPGERERKPRSVILRRSKYLVAIFKASP